MPRTRKGTPPAYSRHVSGQARVRLPQPDGSRREVLLGVYGSPESYQEYERKLAEWRAGRPSPQPHQPAPLASTDLTVNELMVRYIAHVDAYYVKDGQPTSEADTIRQALRFVKRLHGETLAREFGPTALKAIRQAMIEHPISHSVKVRDETTGKVKRELRVLRVGLTRRVINKQIGRIKQMFAWGVENELLPGSVSHALRDVKGLQRDRSAAREKATVKPVANEHVEAVLPLLPAVIRTMVQVQQLCAGRPQDVIEMKPCDIDRTGPVWEYRPGRHKGQHHDRERIVFLGPKAQALLAPWLETAPPDEFVFSPFRAEAERMLALRRARGLPTDRPVRNSGKWKIRTQYDADSYRRAVRRACKKAGVPIWFPLQLRHSAGTAIRKRYGLEASQAVLGHAELGVTQVYAEVDRETAAKIMAEIG